jgi:glutathione S-transferase
MCCLLLWIATDIQPAAAEANNQKLIKLLDEAEQQLGGSPFLAGNCYSVADVVFTPVLFR